MSSAQPHASPASETLARLFLDAVSIRSRPDALRVRKESGWVSISHDEVLTQVRSLVAVLEDLGISTGDRVAILSENRPEWAVADYASLCLGAVDVPLYPTLPADQVAYILRDSEAKGIFVSTASQLAKVLEIHAELPHLEWIVVFDETDAQGEAESFASVLARGARLLEQGSVRSLEHHAGQVRPDDLATLIYTSGTTGFPKGVMLTHANISSNVAAVRDHRVVRFSEGDVALSFLPLSHAFERTVDYFYWTQGVSIAYVAQIEAVSEAMREVRPHAMVAVPRLYEKIHAKVMAETGVKRKLIQWAVSVGSRVIQAEMEGRDPSLSDEVQYMAAERLVFSKIREKTGGRLKAFISGGAPLSAEVARFFFAVGLPVYEGYGLTETSPVLTANRPGKVRLGSVGEPLPDVEIKISEEGEILARGPNIMKGYWKRPDDSAEVLDSNGWFHTGDVGELDDQGRLLITDRLKNLIVTAGGKKIAPAPIEAAATSSVYVSQVVMLGDRRPFPILLVVPDMEALHRWASEKGLLERGEDLLLHPLTTAFVREQTVGQLKGLARYEMPKKIALIAEEFTIESGLLTPTLKVKRSAVERRYHDLIESLYEGFSERSA